MQRWGRLGAPAPLPIHSFPPLFGASCKRQVPSLSKKLPTGPREAPSGPLGRGSTRGAPHLPSTPAAVGWCPLLASEATGKDGACHTSQAAHGPGSEKPWRCPQLQASGLLMGQRIKNRPHHSSAHPPAPPTVTPAFPSSKLLTQFFSLPEWSLSWKSQKKRRSYRLKMTASATQVGWNKTTPAPRSPAQGRHSQLPEPGAKPANV